MGSRVKSSDFTGQEKMSIYTRKYFILKSTFLKLLVELVLILVEIRLLRGKLEAHLKNLKLAAALI
jgi:hypothetical protein